MSTDEPPPDMAQARERLAAMPRQTKQRLFRLIRAASDVPLGTRETQSLAELLLAMRGEGIIESLESGYKLFLQPNDEPAEIVGPGEVKRSRRSRTVAVLSPEEGRELLAALVAQRHEPTGATRRQKRAE